AGDLARLLDAAERFAVRGAAEPSSTFADQLEATLLSRFAARPGDTAAAEQVNGETEAASTSNGLLPSHAIPSTPSDARPSNILKRYVPRPVSAQWRAVAALLLLGVGILGGLVAAARSGMLLTDATRLTRSTQTPAVGEGGSVRAHLQ